MKNLLIVIDMVNGFVNFGALADKNIDKITPTIIDLIKSCKQSGFDIVAFRDAHSKTDEEFKIFPEHCLDGTEESELIPQLKELSYMFDYIIGKNTTNGFITQQFQNLLKDNEYDNVVVCGCCTDICVENFACSYSDYIKNNHLKTKIFVVGNACYTFNGDNHNADECHKNALQKMVENGIFVVNTKELESEMVL